MQLLLTIVVCLFAGAGAGLGTGFAGMSAAAVITPMLVTFLHIEPYTAVGIALASDVLASAVSAYTYGRNRNLDIRNGLIMMITVLAFTVVGSLVSSLVPSVAMGNFSVIMTLLLGIKFIVRPVMTTKEDMQQIPKRTRIIKSIVCGAIVGFICGFIGAGGGMMMLLLLTGVMRLFNRMNDLIPNTRLTGEIHIDGKDIYGKDVQVDELRKKVGMVFQRPNPFPKSIFENVAYGLRVNGVTDNSFIRQRVEESLRGAALWEEVKDKLKVSAYALSGGQQQRLCIARAMAVSPSVLLMDEPASALDPISTAKVEELIHELKEQYTIVIVTHNMQQAARVSDKTAFFYLGQMVEFDDTKKIFTNPDKVETQNYITGRFG